MKFKNIIKVIILLIVLTFNISIAQSPYSNRYVIRDLLANELFIIDSLGNEIAKIDTKDFYINGAMHINYFDLSKLKIYLTKKTDKTKYTLDANGKLEMLSENIGQIIILSNNRLLVKKKEHYVLCDHKMNELKYINLSTEFKVLSKDILIVKNNTTTDWHICNVYFEEIHNIGKDIAGRYYHYGEGWTLVVEPEGDAKLYHISGSVINVNQLLKDKFDVIVDNPHELKVHEISESTFLVKVGNAYFKAYYFKTDGELIWKSEKLDIKSASSFVDGTATIERYNTSFDEYLALKKENNGIKRTYSLIKIDSTGDIKSYNSPKDPEQEFPDIEEDVVEVAYTHETIYSDQFRSLITSQISRSKRYFALIDHGGKVYWENSAKE